jgi:arylsulfatase A-like enzyme
MTTSPNIILIVADDMGYGDFGVFNEGRARTLALDQLAAEGVCLTQHYSASAVCAPARAGLLTGRYPHRTGAIDTLEGRGLDRLALRETTVADIFSAHGYQTGLIGKWHNGALDPRYHPNQRGFGEFAGFRGGWQDYYEWRLDYNGSYRTTDGRYLTNVFTDEAQQFITRHQNEPFFLHLAYNAPHFPLQAPEAAIWLYRERFNEGVSRIYAMNEVMDQGIGQILEHLGRLHLTDNTVVMFTSDNGPQMSGDGDMDTTRFNCQFNGAKGLVYEGGIRVPLIIRWPDGLDGGRYFDDFVHYTDWLPTLLAVAGLEPPDDLKLDGLNVLPVLRGEAGEVNPRRFWQWNRYTPLVTSNAAMRDGDWKLVRPRIQEAMVVSPEDLQIDRALKYQPESIINITRGPEPERTVPSPPPPQLFNLRDDPLEQHDLAEQQPERVNRMLAELETWFAEVEQERRSIRD